MGVAGRQTAALTGIFLASGAAALIYEIVWFQQLGLVLGATSFTLGILLTSFMGGMGLGSWYYPRFASPGRHPLRDYALLELAIAVWGGVNLFVLPRLGDFYALWGSPGTSDLPFRAMTALAVLVPPTVFMGATLPAVSRGLAATPAASSRLGLFYGANTLGAVVGCLAAGLYLLRVHDVATATTVAIVLNLTCAGAAASLARVFPQPVLEPAVIPRTSLTTTASVRWMMFIAACSGMTALGAEVVWTRLLALLLGPTTYTFSILLAVFLAGLGLGSAIAAVITPRLKSPAVGLAVVQLLLALAIPFTATMIVAVLPGWFSQRPEDATLWDRLGGDVLRATLALLPPTLLWGATFPLAIAVAMRNSSERDAGPIVSRVYAANTSGAIVGALGISLSVHPWFGSQIAQQVLTAFAGVTGIGVLLALAARRLPDPVRLPRWVAPAAAMIVIGGVAILPATPASLIAHGNQVVWWNTDREVLFVREGLHSAVAVMESHQGNRCFHVAGRIEATNTPNDMRTQRLLGHLPAVAHPYPRKVLVIGCGSGMTAGSFLLHPSVEEIVLCEIEPAVVEANRVHFAEYNENVLNHPKTRIVYDDARHFLATTRETFDIISTDPIHPWVRGSAALYTSEFYELCRRRMNPDGVITQWVPLYESNHAAVKCELATLLDVFPDALLFSGQSRRSGYDLVVVGRMSPQGVGLPRMMEKLVEAPWNLRQSLAQIGLFEPRRLEETFVATGHELKEWLGDAERNRDGNLRLQYLAGITPDAHTENTILYDIGLARAQFAGSRRPFAH